MEFMFIVDIHQQKWMSVCYRSVVINRAIYYKARMAKGHQRHNYRWLDNFHVRQLSRASRELD